MFDALNIIAKIFHLTSNIKNLTFIIFFFLQNGNVMHSLRKVISINWFTVNITGCRRFQSRVAGHKPFAALGTHAHTHTHTHIKLLLLQRACCRVTQLLHQPLHCMLPQHPTGTAKLICDYFQCDFSKEYIAPWWWSQDRNMSERF